MQKSVKNNLVMLYSLGLGMNKRIEDRRARDRAARRAQIIAAARQIAEAEGWVSVTVRRLSDEISYSQPVLYSHFENREAIVAAVAIAGFHEFALALKKARLRLKRGNPVEAVANAYLSFAAGSPALYEAMFTYSLDIPFGELATPPELQFAFSQILELFTLHGSASETLAEVFWASLHGLADLARTKRLPLRRQRERLKTIVSLFSIPAKQIPGVK